VGGEWGSGSITLSTGIALVVNASATPQTLSPGQTTQLGVTVSGGLPPYSYAWTGAVSNPTIANPTATPNTNSIYTVTVTDANGTRVSATVSVLVNLVLSINASAAIVDPMQQVLLGVVAFGGTPPYTFTWSPAASLSDPHSTSPTATPAVTTTYQVTAVDSQGLSGSGSILVQVTLHVSASANPTTINQGQNAVLNANVSGGSPPYTYSWVPVTGLSQTNIANPIASPPSTTVYTVTVVDSVGTQGMASTTLTVNAPSGPVCSFTLTIQADGSVEADASASTSSVQIIRYEFTQIWSGDPAQPYDACFVLTGHPIPIGSGCVSSNTPWLYNWFGQTGDTARVRVVDANNNSAASTGTVP
jgi:hypothetical protein